LGDGLWHCFTHIILSIIWWWLDVNMLMLLILDNQFFELWFNDQNVKINHQSDHSIKQLGLNAHIPSGSLTVCSGTYNLQ
jgi:hypothetical protein